MLVVRRAESEIETTTDGDTSELSPTARMVLRLEPRVAGGAPRALHFAVSNILVQLLIHDPRLKLTAEGYENEKSRNDLTEEESDELFGRFVAYVDEVAAHEFQLAHANHASQSDAHHPAAGSSAPQSSTEKKTSQRVVD
jgi:hypothetical protein